MTVLGSLGQGLLEAARRWRVVLALYLINLIAAVALAAPMAALLDRSIGRSVAATGIEAIFRFGSILDFARTEHPALADHFQTIAVGVILYAAAAAVLTGGVIDLLRSQQRAPFLPRFFGGCGRFAFRYLRLLGYLAVVLLAVSLLNRGLNRVILAGFDQTTHEMAAFWVMRGKQVFILLVLILLSAVFDLARILTAVEDRSHMIGALLTSFGFVARHFLRVAGIYALLALAGALLFLPGLLLAQRGFADASIAGLFGAQQLTVFLRHGVRVAIFASLLTFYRGRTGGMAPAGAPAAARAPAASAEEAAGPVGGSDLPMAPRVIVPLLSAALSLGAGPGTAAAAAPRPGAPLSRRVVDYRIEASLDPSRHLVTGRETVLYRNDSSRPMTDLKFHLYPNAFSNTHSTYMRGVAWDDPIYAAQIERMKRDRAWGAMTVTSILGPDGKDRTASSGVDETILTIPLAAPVPPGGTARVELAWETRLPRTLHRIGWWGRHHDVVQWFPKPAVWSDSGWKIYPFYRHSEFFADFGTFEVALTVPADYRVEATGVPAGTRDNPDGTRTSTYRAEDVHDFAWIADPNLVLAREVLSEGPYATAPVEIVYAHQPDRAVMAPRILRTVKDALLYYGGHFMPYPWPRIVVDDLPMGLSGGMEYPMLFTVSMASFHPGFYTAAEEVTMHEFGHQYWYGILASNEFEEPWIDEGINSFVTRRALDATRGQGRPGRTVPALTAYAAARVLDEGLALPLGGLALNLDQLIGFDETPFRPGGDGLLGARLEISQLEIPGLVEARLEGSRQSYAAKARDNPLATPAWEFRPGSFYTIVYDKTDLVLETIGRRLGGDVLDRALRAYVERFRFRHPTANDFLETLRDTAARLRPDVPLDPIIQQLVYGTGTVDVAVESFLSREARRPVGLVPAARAGEPPIDRLNPPEPGPGEARFETEVIVRRLGEVVLPVDLLVVFENGGERRETWDGRDTWKRYLFDSDSRAVRAVLDPERVYPVDVDINNNGRTIDRQAKPLLRLSLLWLSWMQILLGLASSLS